MQVKTITLLISLLLSTSSQATVITKSFPSLTGWYDYYDRNEASFDLGAQFSSITSASIQLTAGSVKALGQACFSNIFDVYSYQCSLYEEYPNISYVLGSRYSGGSVTKGVLLVSTTDTATTSRSLSTTNALLDGKGDLSLAINRLELLGPETMTGFPRIGVLDVTLTIDGTVEAYIPEEPKLTFLDILYLYTIDKIADQNGFDHWDDIYNELYSRLNASISPTDSATKVTLDLLQSQPFLNLELNDSDFIYALHEMLYDRAPNQNELDSWTQILESGKLREMVAYDLLRSQEFKNLTIRFDTTAFNEDDNALFQLKSFVQRFYQLVLDREPDSAGFKYWSAQLAEASEAGGDIAKGFFQSSEFINRQTTDSEFLDIAYRSFFDREAGHEGKNYWMNELSLGKSRLDIINGFASSQEFFDLARSFGIATSSDDDSNIVQIKGFVRYWAPAIRQSEKKHTKSKFFCLLTIEKNSHSEYFQGTVASQEHLKQQLAPVLLSSEGGQSYG
jgi:hypothetical protein